MTAFRDNPWDLFPEHRHLGTEESGNEIVVDTSSGDAGPVFGLWHDPPAIVVLARNEQELRALVPGLGSGDDTITLPEAIHDRMSAALAWSKSNAMTIEAARAKLGASYSDWLSGLPPDAAIHDLRAAAPGTGFEWADRTTFTRHPASAVFASVTPPAKPGFFKRLFG
jgi:hypothetical protein